MNLKDNMVVKDTQNNHWLLLSGTQDVETGAISWVAVEALPTPSGDEFTVKPESTRFVDSVAHKSSLELVAVVRPRYCVDAAATELAQSEESEGEIQELLTKLTPEEVAALSKYWKKNGKV